MDAKAHATIKRGLRFEAPRWINAMVVAIDLCLVAASAELLRQGGSVPFWVAQVLLAVVYFHNFGLFHDAVHGSAARSARANRAVGLYASMFCFLPFDGWKDLHLRHHKWSGNLQKDPAMKAVRDFDPSKKLRTGVLRVAWASWIPLLAVIQHSVFWGAALRHALDPKTRGYRRAGAAVSALLPLAPWLALAAQLGVARALAMVGPSIVLYLALTELINFPHHLGTETVDGDARLDFKDQHRVSRSSYFPPVVAEALFLNFNFHVEHHLFPTLPWTELRRARSAVRGALATGYRESRGIKWNLESRRFLGGKEPLRVFMGEAAAPAAPARPATPARRPRSLAGTARRLGRRAAFKLVQSLPTRWRVRLGRRLLALPMQAPGNLVVKIADTQAELEAAFKLVQESYVAEGFARPNASGLRVTKYHMLPTTTVIVAKEDDVVVATLSVIQDGAFGVPMDSAFDLDELRRRGARFAEISSLAVAPARRNSSALLFFLTKFMFQFSRDELKLNYWVATANPKHNYLYETIWLFSRFPAPITKVYDFAAGAPAVPWINDLGSVIKRYYQTYGEAPDARNLAYFYDEHPTPFLALPRHAVGRGFASVMSPGLFKHFFVDRTDMVASLSQRESSLLREIYRSAPQGDLVAASANVLPFYQRRDVRIFVPWRARLWQQDGALLGYGDVRDVSRRGLGLLTPTALEKGAPIEIDLAVSEFDAVRVRGRVARSADGVVGIEVSSAAGDWDRLLDELEQAWLATPSLMSATSVKEAISC